MNLPFRSIWSNLIVMINYGRGFIVLLAGGGILQNPAASNTGSNSRTRPGMLPSIMLRRERQHLHTLSIMSSSKFQLAIPKFGQG